MSARMGRGIALAALLVIGLTGVAWAQSVTVTLDLTGSGSGTVTSSPAGFSCTGSAHTCTASFAMNTTVTLTATPASGQTFGGWSGACTGTAGCTIVTSTGQLVAAAFNGAAAYVFYHEDAIGSVRAITSEAGATVATHDYQPFGEDVAPLTGDPIRFGGKELDPETGQNYFGARYYRNTLGRFTSVDDSLYMDPFVPQSMNLYAYAYNNPLTLTDATGHDPECPTDECVTVIGDLPPPAPSLLPDPGLLNLLLSGWLSTVEAAGDQAVQQVTAWVTAPRDPSCVAGSAAAGASFGGAAGGIVGAFGGGAGGAIGGTLVAPGVGTFGGGVGGGAAGFAQGAAAGSLAGAAVGSAIGSVACMTGSGGGSGGGGYGGGGGGRNRAENSQFKEAVRRIEKTLQRKLQPDQVEQLHREISKEGYTLPEIVDLGIAMFR